MKIAYFELGVAEFRNNFEQIITLEEDCIHLGPHGQNHFERVTKEFKYDS